MNIETGLIGIAGWSGCIEKQANTPVLAEACADYPLHSESALSSVGTGRAFCRGSNEVNNYSQKAVNNIPEVQADYQCEQEWLKLNTV